MFIVNHFFLTLTVLILEISSEKYYRIKEEYYLTQNNRQFDVIYLVNLS